MISIHKQILTPPFAREKVFLALYRKIETASVKPHGRSEQSRIAVGANLTLALSTQR
jgi:hypothetical protein